MAHKPIEISLSTKSINEAIKGLKEYKSKLETLCKRIVEKMNAEGLQIAQARVSQSPLGKDTITLTTERTYDNLGCHGLLIATADLIKPTDDKFPSFSPLMAVEFGAGIYYNPKPNPKASELGMGVGTYPGQKHAYSNGWWYLGDDGEYHPSHGVKATMPMYSALEEMVNNYRKIVKEAYNEVMK